jgi:uncharacterized protein
MQLYLPIAELSVNMLLILGMGLAVGFLSGLFGVGGGFLLTPLLIFAGIPPAVAVATSANQMIATSISGFFTYWRRGTVDFRMGGVLIGGGTAGAIAGIAIFNALAKMGQVGLLISVLYTVVLVVIGWLMLTESLSAIRKRRAAIPPPARQSGQHFWLHRLPFKMRFRRSKLYISALGPLLLGFAIGILTAMMGVGGGFIMVPALIYLLHMPTNIVIGTSLFQVTFITALVTLLHALDTRSVDLVLATILIVGGVIGAQFGARAGHRLRGEELRAMLAILVLAVAIRLAIDLVLKPPVLFSETAIRL